MTTTGSAQHASGQEVLVVDRDDKVARGLESLLGRLGLVVTVTADAIRAQDLLVNKFFAVALLDIDTPHPGGGLDLLRFARDKSPLTTVLVMTARKAFDIGVAGFRGGAADVVVKEPDAVPYLKDRVVAAASELMAASDRNTLLEEVSELHEEFLRRMRDLSRQCLDLEDRLIGRDNSDPSGVGDRCVVLIVDDDPGVGKTFEAILPVAQGWHITVAGMGGEGLDLAAQIRPQIVLVKDPLPDLPARMVAGTVKKSAPDAVTLVYQPARPGSPGELTMIEGPKSVVVAAGFTGPDQLVGPMKDIRDSLRQKLKERRYLQAFRQANLEFLHRYNSVRQRIQAMLARPKR